MRRFWEQVRRQTLGTWVAAGLLVTALIFLGRTAVLHFEGIEAWIDGLGLWGMAAFVGLFVMLTTAFVPDTLLAIVAGAVFGLVWGLLLVSFAGVLGACVQYGLARSLLSRRIDAVMCKRPTLLAIQRAVLEQQLRLQVLLRLTPLNPTLVSYILGAAGVRFVGFVVAALALIPLFFLEVYAGYAGRSLAGTTAEPGMAMDSWMHDVLLVGGLGVCVLVLVIVTRTARRAVREAVDGVTVPKTRGVQTT